MSMEGDIDDKLNCIIDGQAQIHIRMNGLEKEARNRGDSLNAHIGHCEKRLKQDKEAIEHAQKTAEVIQEIHRNQTTLLEERQDSINFWKTMREKAATTTMLGALGLMGTVVWYAIQHFFIHGPK